MQATIMLCYAKPLEQKIIVRTEILWTQQQKLFTRLIGRTLLTSLVACSGVVKDERDPLENWNRGVQRLMIISMNTR